MDHEDYMAAQLLDLGNVDKQAFSCYEGSDKVVFWPPRPDEGGFYLLNSDEDTNGHWGMNWPVKVLSSQDSMYTVQYDNGAIGNVLAEHVSPKAWNEVPVPFGGEATPLDICEFAEVFNGSEEDPGSWPAVITNLLVGGGYEVFFPFHPTECREQIAAEKIRRYRVWKGGEWRLIHPKCWKAFDRWRGTTIMQPMDLKSIHEDELQEALACKFGCARCRYAGVGCLSCDFNRPNYRGVFQARLLPEFQPPLPLPQTDPMLQAYMSQSQAEPASPHAPPLMAVKKELSPQVPRHSYSKQLNPIKEEHLLEPVFSKRQPSPQQKASSAHQKGQRKMKRQAAQAAQRPRHCTLQMQQQASQQAVQAAQKQAIQQARQWALARAHAQAHAQAQAREHAHALALLEQSLQEMQDSELDGGHTSQENGHANDSADYQGQRFAQEGQDAQSVGKKRPHVNCSAQQQASEKRQKLLEEVERKRRDAEEAERELESLISKEQRASKAQESAQQARRQLAEAQDKLLVEQETMERDLRAKLQAQLEVQLQQLLEQRLIQPRLHIALLENAAAIADNTAAQAAREMDLL